MRRCTTALTTGGILPFLVVMAIGICGCSIKKLAVNSIANALSGEGSLVFSGEDDPQLVADALPFALKMYESLLEQAPDHAALRLATGKAFAMYAFAFVQTPADRLGNADLERKKEEMKRAKKLYLRGRNYILDALDLKYPGFSEQVKKGPVDSALARVTIADTVSLYWAGMSWVGAIMADKFDLGMLLGLKRAVALIEKVASYNMDFGEGAIEAFYISYYGSLPASMGGSEEKARAHFARAVELSAGKTASPYVSLASSVSVNKQDIAEFRRLLDQALAIDVSQRDANRLENILSQQKARWMLDHIEEYFVVEEPEQQDQ